MSFSVRFLPAVLLTLLSLTGSLCAQSTTKQPAKVPRGSVSGRVTIKDKGVPGVAVGLRKGEGIVTPLDPYLRATTDQDGFYRIANVAPGSYSISPSAPAFVGVPKDPKMKTVLLGEDENIEGINFALVRGGVITGRVTDADGRPVIEQQISLYPVENLEKRLADTPMWADRTVQTDDRGIYRFFGLTAGRYKVAAGRADDNAFNFGPADRANYRQVFHPDATDHAKATVIEVSEGSEATNVDITLGRVMQTFSASGLAIDAEKSLPMPFMRLGVQRRNGQRIEYVNTQAISNSRGEFVIEGLIPGSYGIYVSPQSSGDMRADGVNFDIIDQNVEGLTVRLTKGASLTGFVVLENEDKTIFAKLAQLQLRAFAMVNTGFSSGTASPIGPDGNFRLAGLPGGTINLSLGALMNPFQQHGFNITRVERDGIVSTARVEVKDGEQLTGLRVIVSYGTATIRGIVKIENGSIPGGVRLFVRLTKPGEQFPNFRPVTVDARGHYLFEGVPAGTYEVSVMVPGGPSGSRTVKREVILQDGQAAEVNMTIDMGAPPPKP